MTRCRPPPFPFHLPPPPRPPQKSKGCKTWLALTKSLPTCTAGNGGVTAVNNATWRAKNRGLCSGHVRNSCLNPATFHRHPSVTGKPVRGLLGPSWQAHSYDMETMGGSNEEHMLLCFNRAAHCARKAILYSYSGSSQWKSEPSPSQLSLQYPSTSLFFFSSPPPCLFLPPLLSPWLLKFRLFS